MAGIKMLLSEQEFSLRLVEALEKHPCLYNYKLPEYSRKDATDKAWRDVARQVNVNVPLCKAKWKNLRTVFVRKIKPTLSGSVGKSSKPYYLNEKMKFILPFLKPVLNSDVNTQLRLQSSDSTYEADEDNSVDQPNPAQDSEQDNSVDQLNHTQEIEQDIGIQDNIYEEPKLTQDFHRPRAIKRKATRTAEDNSFKYRERGPDDEDYRKMFLLSLMPEINQMNDQQMKQFRRKVLQLIDDITDQRPLSALSTTSSYQNEFAYSEHLDKANIKYEISEVSDDQNIV